MEKREGQDCIFLIEAKTSGVSLAKHKLVYPMLALADKIPEDMPIIPVYLKILRQGNQIHYHTVECSLPDPRQHETIAIDQLQSVKHSVFTLVL